MLTIVHDEGGKTVHHKDPAVIPALMANGARPFWVDLEAPTAEEFALLETVFHFHPLAIEDAMRPYQRPKVDEYEGYFFLVADEVTIDLETIHSPASAADKQQAGDDVSSRQLSVFLGANYLVTIHVETVQAARSLRDRCDRNHRVLERGADFILYTLLDMLVDEYFPLVEKFDDSMDELEDRVVQRPDPAILETIFRLKGDLTRLRRLVGPLREVLQTLTTRNFSNIQESTLPYLRDVADHLFRVYETLDGYRDLTSNMLDAYLSQVSNQMNRVMQKLSIVATIFLPITFVTGVFGMNFADQPWLHTNFWAWMAVMAAVAGLTIWWFRRHRWV